MCRRSPAGSVPVVIDEKRRKAGSRAGAVVGLVLALSVVARLVFHRVLGRDLPDLPRPEVDLPGWLGWIGPVLGAGKLLLLAGLGLVVVLTTIGERSRRRRDGDER
jgi:hypothetical protein